MNIFNDGGDYDNGNQHDSSLIPECYYLVGCCKQPALSLFLPESEPPYLIGWREEAN